MALIRVDEENLQVLLDMLVSADDKRLQSTVDDLQRHIREEWDFNPTALIIDGIVHDA